MLNLSVLIEESTFKYPNRPAYTYADTTLTYAQVNAASNQVANGLQNIGIQKGDKVALSCFNLPYWPIIYYGILKAGATVVPLSVLLKPDEIAYHLTDSDTKAYFCFVGSPELPMGQMGYAGFQQAPQCQHMIMITPSPTDASPIDGLATLGQFISGQSTTFESVRTSAEDTALIIYTSGTTGKPKGAELTHCNLFINATIARDLFALNHEDRTLIVLPLFHIFALSVLMHSMTYVGGHSILLPRFDAETVFGLLQKHEITVFGGVPTMYWGLLNYREPKFDYARIASNLRVAVSGGAALPVQVLQGVKERLGVNILEGYGMSEGSPIVTFNQADVGTKVGSIGTPVWGVQVKLVDDQGDPVAQGQKGELWYRGHNVMKGYYKKPEANATTITDGWLHSGDVAVQDEDGFYFIVDRTKDMIIRGGFNVYPRELEEVIIQHEAVSLVAVIGIPDEKMGEDIKAFVILKEGKSCTAEELKAYAKSKLADYKYPRHIEFVKSLPMSATGKILKKELRKQS